VALSPFRWVPCSALHLGADWIPGLKLSHYPAIHSVDECLLQER
jgi:hypothetical protein